MVWPLVYSQALTRAKGQPPSREPETGHYAAEEGDPEEDAGVEDDDDDDDDDDEADGTLSPTATTDEGSPRWYTRLWTFLRPSPAQPDLNDYLPNYRYTPILSGVVIPFAILLEIPGLTEHWYIRTVDHKTVESRANPTILDIGMAISMTIGLLANICLVLRFLERRVKVMTICCIVFLTIHDTINITAVTIFGVQRRFDDGFTYGQAFWSIVCSTIASTLTNVTLIVDFLRTNDFENSGNGLTRKQRSLVIVVIVLMCYIALGALVHSYLLQLSFINALYFSVVTIETVGLGDITPKTTGARVFVCFYSAFGVLNVALAVGQTRDTVLEALEVAYRKRLRDVGARRRERQRQVRVHQRWLDAVTWRLNKMQQPVWVDDEESSPRKKVMIWVHRMWESGVRSRGGRALLYYDSHRHGMHLNLEVLTGAQLESAALEAGVPLSTLLPPNFRPRRGKGGDDGEKNPKRAEEAGSSDMPLTHTRIGRMVGMLGKFANAVYHSGRLAGDIPLDLPPTPRITPLTSGGEARFESFKVEMEREEEKAFYASLTVAWTLFLAFWIAGSAIFHATEGWPLGSTMYFCFMSFMTIGYGDFAPVTPAGRSIFVLWALMGIATMTILISIISEAYTSRYKHALRSDPFAKAVERYRAKGSRAATRRSSRSEQSSPLELGGNDADAPAEPDSRGIPAMEKRDEALEPHKLSKHQEQTKAQLEALPAKILHHAQVFQEHVQYFAGNGNTSNEIAVPDGVKRLMDDIVGAEKLGKKIKAEILQDDDARQTLFTLGIEEELKKIICMAEDAVRALAERDRLQGQPIYHDETPATDGSHD
ncbi:two pore domain potassium channel family protein [Pleurotus pulmonarius]